MKVTNIFMLMGLMGGLLFWPVIGSAALYKWTDEQGNLHITDTPPPVAQKKSAMTATPRSTLPKKTTARPTLPGQPQAHVYPLRGPVVPSPKMEEAPIQRAMEGLSPSQATLTSAWQLYESTQMNTKAPVQRWKDEQGLDHFVDILPIGGGYTEAGVKERATSISRSRHQSTE
jgi:hypothetical protein